jgi:hypothetical protein
VIEVRDGRMVGETLYYDLETLCRQAGYTIDPLRLVGQALASPGEADVASLPAQNDAPSLRGRCQASNSITVSNPC